MNKAFLIGRLTRDVEMRTATSGTLIANFSLAVNRNFTNADGEREADFINCIAFNKTGENIAKYTHKGSQLAVGGRIQTRNYDASDGTKRYVTEVIVDEFSFLDKKEDKVAEVVIEEKEHDPFEDFGNEITLTDDDLPW